MRKQKGFTLVELVVVVMILGILAAVAAPKLLGTSSRATDNGAKQTLAVVRDAIERYAAEHGGTLPGADTSVVTFKANLATYLRGEFPKCAAFGDNDDVEMTAGMAALSPTGSKSWQYGYESGQFIINSGGALKSDPSLHYDEL